MRNAKSNNLNLPPISGNPSSNRAQSNDISFEKRRNSKQFSSKGIKNPNSNLQIINEETKSYIEEMSKGSYNILVCVRCRPLSSLEYQLSSFETIKIMDNKIVVLMDPIEYNGPNTVFKNRSREQTYAFDFAFDKSTGQTQVFENSTKFLIEGVVNGYNATVFAYGATGAGKTYTMLGNEANPGIMPMTLQELFNKVNSFNDREYKLKFWYLEIYNENIRDLLKTNNGIEDNEYLDLREDPIKGIMVSGITEVNVNNSKDMLKILKKGNRNRTQEATGANETSSRSHAILQVAIEYKEKNSGIDIEIKYSKLSLIDLAGSERASATQNRGIRLIEGANINRSLLTLGNCINALCDASSKGIKKPYIPYRDSKLTRLLKDSLGGNARTVMIANVSPSIHTFDDTYNTLKYANRAKNIKTVVTRNVLNAQYHISNYVNIINNLKKEVASLKAQLGNKAGNISFDANNISIIQNNNPSNYNTISANNRSQNTSFVGNSSQPNGRSSLKEDKVEIISNVNNNEKKFDTALSEMKNLCENQLNLKQKMITTQNEMNKLKEIIEMNKNICNVNNDISYILNKTDNNANNIDLNNDINYKNKQSEYESKMSFLRKTLNINTNKYKEIATIIDKVYDFHLNKKNFTNKQMEHLNLLVKYYNQKVLMLETKYNTLMNKAKSDIKDDYINILENQIKLRDEIFAKNNINIYDATTISGTHFLKEVDVLRLEYKSKFPRVKMNSCSGNLLPPIASSGSISHTNPNNLTVNEYSTHNLNNNASNNNRLSGLNIRINNNMNNNNISNNNNGNANKNNNLKNNNSSSSGNSMNNIIKINGNVLMNHTGNNVRSPNSKKLSTNNNNSKNCKAKLALARNYSQSILDPMNSLTTPNKNLNRKAMNRYNSINNSFKRNNKSYIYNYYQYKDGRGKFDNNIRGRIYSKGRREVSALQNNSGKRQNKSFSALEDYNKININQPQGDSVRMVTAEYLPQVKKSDLNLMLNERNKKRQKILDKINSGDKDLL